MHPDFDLPSPGSITGRSSSITAAFIQAVIPVVEPTDAEVNEALAILGMKEGACVCAYCGDSRTEWDHFRPLVSNRRPTGFITEIANLVPSFGKCNQSKGNKHWRIWIKSDAKRSPKVRGIKSLSERIERLSAYENWREPKVIDLEKAFGAALWTTYWANWQQLLSLMEVSQKVAVQLKAIATKQLANQPLQPTPDGAAERRR